MVGAFVILIGFVTFVIAPIVLFVGAIVIGWIDAGRHARGEREILSDD